MARGFPNHAVRLAAPFAPLNDSAGWVRRFRTESDQVENFRVNQRGMAIHHIDKDKFALRYAIEQ